MGDVMVSADKVLALVSEEQAGRSNMSRINDLAAALLRTIPQSKDRPTLIAILLILELAEIDGISSAQLRSLRAKAEATIRALP